MGLVAHRFKYRDSGIERYQLSFNEMFADIPKDYYFRLLHHSIVKEKRKKADNYYAELDRAPANVKASACQLIYNQYEKQGNPSLETMEKVVTQYNAIIENLKSLNTIIYVCT